MQSFSGETITADTLIDDGTGAAPQRFDAVVLQMQTDLGLTIEEAESYALDKIGNPAFSLAIVKDGSGEHLLDQSHAQ